MPTYIDRLHKKLKHAIPSMQITAYSGFTNQPANDSIEVLSSDAGDTQQITLFGYNNADELKYHTVTLNGTSAVTSTLTTNNWKTIIGAFLGDIYGQNSEVATGTITIREASGDQAITTITAGDRSTGNVFFLLTGRDVTVHNKSGSTYLNTNELATTDNAVEMVAGMTLDILPENYLYLAGDISGSEAQVIVWKT